MILYNKTGILKQIGGDGYFSSNGKKETFLIGDDERLIGCELDHGANYFLGIKFIKWKKI